MLSKKTKLIKTTPCWGIQQLMWAPANTKPQVHSQLCAYMCVWMWVFASLCLILLFIGWPTNIGNLICHAPSNLSACIYIFMCVCACLACKYLYYVGVNFRFLRLSVGRHICSAKKVLYSARSFHLPIELVYWVSLGC